MSNYTQEQVYERFLHDLYAGLYPPGGVAATAVAQQWLNVKDYGAVGDGVTDDRAAFLAAIAYSQTVRHRPIFVPVGDYLLTGEIVIPEGIMILGAGSQGSAPQGGTAIHHASTGHCFTFNGTGAAFLGTGGGLQNLLILKSAGFTGGDAIRIVATDDDHRPGEMILANLLIYGDGGTGMWNKGVHVDGSAAATPGTRGVRSMLLHKVRVADCNAPGQWVHFTQVTHVFSTYLQIDIGHGTGDPGITIDGDSDDLFLSGIEMTGTLLIQPPTSLGTLHVTLSGKVNNLTNNYVTTTGVATLSVTGAVLNASKNFRILSQVTDAFMAYRDAEVTNATGDGTFVTVTYTGEIFDRAGSFDPATGIFTAKCAGRYHFSCGVLFRAVGAAHTRGDVILTHFSGAGPGVVKAYSTITNPATSKDATGNTSPPALSMSAELALGDTVTVQVVVSNGAKTVSLGVTSAVAYVWFAGNLVG